MNSLINKALNLNNLSFDEAVFLYKNTSLNKLIFIANEIRKKLHPKTEVSWIIDRNINISNICMSSCLFCNFCRSANSPQAYTTSIEDYKKKIKELYKIGGNQLLLQGGLNHTYNLNFYLDLFKSLKKLFPKLKLHALSPPEIIHLAKTSDKSIENILFELSNAGLDTLPGGGAEILSDRVRQIISPLKCSSTEWLNVMRIAHNLNITSSATMMFGHLETIEERIEHLIKIRDLQAIKPASSKGFISFTSWPLQAHNTRLNKKYGPFKAITKSEYIKTTAFSRIVLNNIPNIQVSWLTIGKDVAQLCLHAGANDLGSIMMEENVVSSAGINKTSMEINEMQQIIQEAGFIPIRRNQEYEYFN